MRVYRLALSFVAATVVVLTMLLVGLKIFNGHQGRAVAIPQTFEVEYLTPEEAALLLKQGPDKE